MTISPSAGFTLNNPGGTLDLPGATIVVDGTAVWLAGTIRGNGSSVIINNGNWIANGVKDQMNDASYGGTPTFNNNSYFVVEHLTNGATTLAGVAFNNTFNASNSVDVQSGTLQLSGGGFLNGGFIAEAGANLVFSSGAFTTGPNLSVSGPGNNSFASGTLVLSNDVAGLTLAGGTVTLGPNFQSGGAITNLTISGSMLAGTNMLLGTMNWLAGAVAGALTISPGGVLNLSGATAVSQWAALTNSGQINWNGSGDWSVNDDGGTNHGLINNLSGGVINVQCNNSLYAAYYGLGRVWFNNAGVFTKTMSTNTTRVSIAFTNTGTVTLGSGALVFGNGSFGGNFQAANGTQMSFNNGGVLAGVVYRRVWGLDQF